MEIKHDSPEDVKAFEESLLEDKMVQYEQGLVTHPGKLKALFQELIDEGQCWDENFYNHTHYARMAAYYLRTKACHLHNTKVEPPEEWRTLTYLYVPIWEGYDTWGRPPTDVDWGRPYRWQEIRTGLIKKFNSIQERKERGIPVAVPLIPKPKGCCGK
jgi:hypothetical protein